MVYLIGALFIAGLRPHGRSGLKYCIIRNLELNGMVSAHTGGVD